MKKILVLLSAGVLMLACTGNKTTAFRQSVATNYSGVWVLTDYIKMVDSTKSPAQSRVVLRDIVSMVIDTLTAQDSLLVDININNHEGWFFTAYLENEQTAGHLKTDMRDYDDSTNYYELGIEVINNENFLFLYHYNEANELLQKVQFTKVADKTAGDDMRIAYGIQYVVNEKIFAGDYTVIEGNYVGADITFQVDGSLTGLPGISSYYVFTDYAISPSDYPDVILFDFMTPQRQELVFQVQQDTLALYKSVEFGQEGTGNLKAGALAYKLARKK